jgi:hypothetical protein
MGLVYLHMYVRCGERRRVRTETSILGEDDDGDDMLLGGCALSCWVVDSCSTIDRLFSSFLYSELFIVSQFYSCMPG